MGIQERFTEAYSELRANLDEVGLLGDPRTFEAQTGPRPTKKADESRGFGDGTTCMAACTCCMHVYARGLKLHSHAAPP